jgi:osmotically-inducible protein OsmY
VKDGHVTLDGTIFDERERDAIRVCAENQPGVRGVTDQLIWVDPSSGTFLSPPA